ncbi:MAG: hypothetical protein HKM94_06295 [Halobacteria archaeon]|nr:hypothetical protein [Halobacteria archaeon]
MKSYLDDIPVYESIQTTVSAEHFNLVQIALKRLGSPIRFELPKLRTLDFLLDEETWIIVDRSLNDIPVMAWLNFETKDRSLHEALNCTLNLYHAHANIIHPRVIEAMTLLLGEQLADKESPGNGSISKLPADD